MKASWIALGLLAFSFSVSVPAAENCTVVHSDLASSLQKCGNVKILVLKGTPEERARTHGQYLAKFLSRDVLGYFEGRIRLGIKDKALPMRWLAELANGLLARALFWGAPEEMKVELNAMADGMGIRPGDLRRAIALPDIVTMLNAWNASDRLEALGCTSVALKTPKGYVYGRNLDFASATLWDAHPLITVHIPPAGANELRHVAFGADGVHFAGITGFNEAGIAFSVHQNYSREAHLGGVPMFLIGEKVLRTARNLEEAENILRDHRPGPLWTFVISDLKVGKSIAIETSKKQFAVRRMDGDRFAQSNHVDSLSLRDLEHIDHGIKVNSVLRLKKAMELISGPRSGEKPLETAARALAYHENADGDLSADRDIIKALTIQTIFLEKNEKDTTIYLSSDLAPSSTGRFVRFRVEDFFGEGDVLRKRGFETVDLVSTPPTIRAKQVATGKAFAAYFDHKDYGAALEHLQGQNSPDARLFRSIVFLHQDRLENAVSEAKAAESAVLPKGAAFSDEMRDSVRWVQMIALERMKKHAEAVAVADQILRDPMRDETLWKVARKVHDGKVEASDLKLRFDFFSGLVTKRVF